MSNRLGRFGGRVREVAEQVQVVEIRERARQIVLDEALRAPQALQADLDENAGRILDVVARRLHQSRHLPQLREDPPRALGERRVVEQDLTGDAGREQVAVMLRVAFPGSDGFQFVETGADVGVERGPFEALHFGQPCRVDRREPAGEPSQRADLVVNRRPAQILQQVVMKVDAVERRIGGMDLVQPIEVLVNEVR